MRVQKIDYLKTILILCCAFILLSGCASGISRTGYRLPAGKPPADIATRLIVVKRDAHYDTNEVTVLGSIHAYDTGFSTRCDESYVLSIFSEEGRILGADVINLTEEEEPNFWSSCYQAKAQFLRFKDRKKTIGLTSDPRYAPDLVAERSIDSIEQGTANLNTVVLGSVLGGAIGGAIAGGIVSSTSSSLADVREHAENGDAFAC
jgi:outer membrane lipoprotein SlyB